MAYTRVWLDTAVTGATLADDIDAGFQNLRGDLTERMESKLITSMTADPWVVKPEILGNVNGKLLQLHSSAFETASDNSPIFDEQNVTSSSGSGTDKYLYALILPVGDVVQNITALLNRQGQSVTIALKYIDAVTGAITTVATVTDNITAGIFSKNLGADIAHTIVAGRFYYVFISTAVSVGLAALIYGATVKYDTPDTRNCL